MTSREPSFSNREITAMFETITQKLDFHSSSINTKLDEHNVVHGEILRETRATNGKVASIQRWREQMNGAIKVLAFIIPTIFALLGWMSYEIIHIDDRIQEALSIYEIP